MFLLAGLVGRFFLLPVEGRDNYHYDHPLRDMVQSLWHANAHHFPTTANVAIPMRAILRAVATMTAFKVAANVSGGPAFGMVPWDVLLEEPAFEAVGAALGGGRIFAFGLDCRRGSGRLAWGY